MIVNLACVVEGKGDAQAVPVLLRRFCEVRGYDVALNVLRPIRTGRQKLVNKGKVNQRELERTVGLAVGQLKPPCAILVLMDADEDCPAELGPKLLACARQARSDVAIGVVLAKSEFEAWFLAAIESIGGKRGLPDQLAPVDAPEEISGAKGYLTRKMRGTRAYSPATDQAAFAAVFDMERARERSDSFDKCWREVERLISEATEQGREGGNPVGSD